MRFTVYAYGLYVGTYEGQSKEEALDIYAQDAGYKDYADLLARIPGGTEDEKVREVPAYCTQNNGDCETCPLVNFRKDCHNNPI
ncbi:MAG: hypothetical protein ACMUJM_12600 [bacterium]